MKETDADDEVGIDGGMTVAALATVLALGLVIVGVAALWMHAMHRAGQGRGFW